MIGSGGRQIRVEAIQGRRKKKSKCYLACELLAATEANGTRAADSFSPGGG